MILKTTSNTPAPNSKHSKIKFLLVPRYCSDGTFRWLERVTKSWTYSYDLYGFFIWEWRRKEYVKYTPLTHEQRFNEKLERIIK